MNTANTNTDQGLASSLPVPEIPPEMSPHSLPRVSAGCPNVSLAAHSLGTVPLTHTQVLSTRSALPLKGTWMTTKTRPYPSTAVSIMPAVWAQGLGHLVWHHQLQPHYPFQPLGEDKAPGRIPPKPVGKQQALTAVDRLFRKQGREGGQEHTCSHCTPSSLSHAATSGGGSACAAGRHWVWSSWTRGCPRHWTG